MGDDYLEKREDLIVGDGNIVEKFYVVCLDFGKYMWFKE